MKRLSVGVLTAAVFLNLTPAARPADADDDLVDQVRKAIDAGVAYLRAQQRGGSWELGPEKIGYPGGSTSLVLLALLTSGVPPSDPAVQDGLAYLRTVPPAQTYVVGLQTMVFAMAKQPADRGRIRRNVEWLLKTRMPDGWTYRGPGGIADGSNTQYALLGLHEGLRSGAATIDPEVLQALRKLFIETQGPGGGWRYRPGVPASMTMTTAGLCNLVITGMDLAVGKQDLDLATGVAKNCGAYEENEPVARGLGWIGANLPGRLTADNAPDVLGSPFYCLYGLERAGRLSGQRFIGGHDWYEVGCRYLVSIRRPDGSWHNSGRSFDQSPLIATSFALLFLSKGRTPILVSKLAYGPIGDYGWNNKRNDLRNLVEFCSKEIFKDQPLAWQAFDVRQKQADNERTRRQLAGELLPSPVVFFNGHDFAPRGKEEDVLKEYLHNGGFVFAEACCGREDFDKDFRALMRRLFPESELRPVPPDHPVWTASGKFAVPPDAWPLEGIQHGCKWVVLYSREPIAGYWEDNLFNKDAANPKTKKSGKLAFELGANVIAYATGLEAPRPRLTRVEIIGDDQREAIRRGYLKVAQLRHDGDWQPAPKAMPHLMAEMRKVGLDVVLQTTPVHLTQEKVLDFGFFYMHGRRGFDGYGARDLEKLHFKLTNGGTLLADACCGSKDFDASFRRLMKVLWAPENLNLEPIPLTDDLLGADLNGTAIRTVRCRREGPDGKGVEKEFHAVAPQLEGIKYHGRWVVVYSRYDLGCALERNPATDCKGHDYESAVRLGKAVVLYALKR
jgi:hypothetical protein